MAKNLAYLPAMEELARERLYDRNPKGGPTRDARGLAKGSLDKNFYKDKRVKKNILSVFVGNIRQKFKDFVTDKTGVKTIEMINACFEADKPYIVREPNKDYIKREIEWYESQSLFVQDIPGETPAIWKSVASNLGIINSNYGWLTYSNDNWNQYNNVLKELNDNPDSRRANMIYTRPAIWQDYKIDGMSDFIFTNNVHYFIR